MFGLEGNEKKKKKEDFQYDLEKELKDPKIHHEIVQKVKDGYKKSKNFSVQAMTRKNLTGLICFSRGTQHCSKSFLGSKSNLNRMDL